MDDAVLTVHAGTRAMRVLGERGLRAEDVRVVSAAAGGPKGLVLLALDRYLFGTWMHGAPQVVHLLGASIGAWRMAAACLPDAGAAFDELARHYIGQQYHHAPGKAPAPAHVSEVFGGLLRQHLGRQADLVLSHPTRRLHVFTSHGRHLLARQGRWRTPLGYLGAFIANAASRRALGSWLERVVYGDPRDELPFPLADFRTRRAALRADNLAAAVLASCSIPFWLDAVHDVPGGPRGAHWDGGITDYHLHLPYASMADGLVLYPHFQPRIVPGWLDKAFKARHRPSAALDNVVVLAPSARWIASLPGGRLPDRTDFKRYGDDRAARVKAWRAAVAESERLAEAFDAFVRRPDLDAVQPLA